MSTNPVELYWFPNYSNRFVTRSHEINLYEVNETNHTDDSVELRKNLEISSTTSAKFLASETCYQYIRCIAPSYHRQGECLVAVGMSSGKVGLCNFLKNDNNIEFNQRQSRYCLCLAWNQTEPNLLAMGHDRHRADHSITIWDTERGGGASAEDSTLGQIGVSETAFSLCWTDMQNRTIAAGLSNKFIKLFDLNQTNPCTATVNTRAVYGLTMTNNGRYLASYTDNLVLLWDVRHLDKAVDQFKTQKNITHLSWCPTRTSLLATLQRDSSFVHLLDMHLSQPSDCETTTSSEMVTFHSIERYVAPFHVPHTASVNERHLTTGHISWHPTDFERLLVLSGCGSICDFTLPPRVAVAWDTENNIWGSAGMQLQRMDALAASAEAHSNEMTDDIAVLMRCRAKSGYGLMPDIESNGNESKKPLLKLVWRQLSQMLRSGSTSGVKAILGISNGSDGQTPAIAIKSDVLQSKWFDFPAGPSHRVYKSEQRKESQILCGWTYLQKENGLNDYLDEMCAVRREYTRAALICCFNLHIRQAIEILGRSADASSEPNSLGMAAIALAGFNLGEKAVGWRNQCNIARSQITDPHLRAIFGFLALDNTDNYDVVLNESGVLLSDRVAFACTFLNDLKLAEFIRSMIASCIKAGDLNGLLLTGGASEDAINLLQSHLDWTEDVQTVALICCKFLSPDILIKYSQCHYWIESYRNLLDVWGLWLHRAQFDVHLGKSTKNATTMMSSAGSSTATISPRSTRSVFLQCTFCGKSVSASVQEEARLRTTSTNKLSSCPNCRKPLPRCALCLMHMGGGTFSNDSADNEGWRSKPFAKWFSWCQTCRHGGHTEHLIEWFKQHSECPVTSCSCKCFAMDLPIQQFPRDFNI